MNIYLLQFGKTLQKMRKELSLTQNDVSSLSGINTETIRRIEGGKVIPKFETLEFLSSIYKQDLNNLFLQYRIKDHSYFYELKNRLEAKFDRDEFYTLNIELKELNTLLNHIDNLFYRNLIEQLLLITQAVILYKSNNNNNEALNKLIKAIQITTPTFRLDNYKSFIYSSMEIRIIMNIAFILHKLNYKEKYLEIMKFCINSVDSDDELYPKLCHNLAGVYIRNKNFNKALEYSNMGIQACQENRNPNGLNLLYYGKGISEYNLGKCEHIKSLETSISLCEALKQDELKAKIINNCKEIFKINL